ncbi:unnamed protein product, partial [marine sediment metagenome]
MKPDDLPYALGWLKTLASQRDVGYLLHLELDEIMVMAWRHLNEPAVLTALAETSIEYFRHYHDLLRDRDTLAKNQDLFSDPERRRPLASKILELSQEQNTRFELTNRLPRIIRQEDFDWCFGQLTASIGGMREEAWAGLMWSLFCWSEPDSSRVGRIIEARAISPCIMAESELSFTPVELGSERAKKLREGYELSASRTQREPELLEPTPKDRIEQGLDRSENGEPDIWWLFLREMTLEATSTHYGQVPLDVRTLPGWLRADSHTQHRMLAAADRFLRRGPVDPLKWQRNPHSWGSFDTAAYSAFYILKQEAPDTYDALPGVVWARHVANVLCSPYFDADDGQKQQHEEIALRCYQQAREAFLFYLSLQLDAEDRENRHMISCDRKLGQCWD